MHLRRQKFLFNEHFSMPIVIPSVSRNIINEYFNFKCLKRSLKPKILLIFFHHRYQSLNLISTPKPVWPYQWQSGFALELVDERRRVQSSVTPVDQAIRSFLRNLRKYRLGFIRKTPRRALLLFVQVPQADSWP